MFTWLKRLFVGSPLPSWRAMHERLPKVLGLAVFSSDAISSVGYATEEILLTLVLAGTALVTGTNLSVYVAIAIVILLVIVVTSYRQTIFSYPSGGGSYIVAKDNLGTYPGLIAGASLMIDYVLTVAVSVSAGMAAILSFIPHYHAYRVELILVVIAFIALVCVLALTAVGVAVVGGIADILPGFGG